jgi:hypothetical protein
VSLLRWLGLLLGTGILAFAFTRFRLARARRIDFAMAALVGAGLVTVSAFPLLLERQQFSRLIAIGIASNLLLWIVVIAIRARQAHGAEQFDQLIRALGVSEFLRLHPEQEQLGPIAIVIPAYEEAENVGEVVRAVPRALGDHAVQCLVIDDGSEDGTSEAAREAGALVVRTPVRRGGGAALRLGFDIALAGGAVVVVTMDADGQHLPSEIEALVRPLLDDEADFVIGSRILGTHERDNTLRFVGIHVFNTLIRMLSSVRVSDCSNGFRALRARDLAKLTLRQDQFHTAELLIDAARHGVRIAEAPVTVKRRASGESKKGRDWTYGLNFARTVLRTWWRD